jgi:glycosyltransferase involved in cell wall biosynthesis
VRIILTCNYSPWSSYSGGGQRSTHNLARAMAERDHQVTVVFTRPPWERVEVPADLPYRVRWAALTSFGGQSPGLLRLSSILPVARAVAALVAKEGPAVVHAQGEESAALPALRRLTGLRFGLVVTPRYPDFPDAVLAGSTATPLARARTALFDSKYVALGAALRGADFCAPPSSYGGRLVQRAFDVEWERIAPVHNGVPVEFLEHRWQPDTRERPLLFFGRFAHDKGIDTLLDALVQLGAQAPRTLLVGRGPQHALIERQIRECGLAERVELRAWADHHELGRLLSESAFAVLPSREENFSLAVLSALAVGTPLITTPVGGTSEVVTHEQNGLLVAPGDVQGLAGAIARLSSEPEFAARLGGERSELVRRDFTWQAAARKFEDLYERALQAA